MFSPPIQIAVTAALLAARACTPEARDSADRTAQANAERETIAQDLDTPWGIDFLPDGRMIFTERDGRVSVVENGSRRTVGNIAVEQTGESGLHGVAVDPDFGRTAHIYLYYTHAAGNRVSRFTLRGGALGEETAIIDKIPRARFHDGGRIRFGPDGMLYVTTGDALEPRLAQDRNSLAGKILRIAKDGSVPADNPFGNPVWAYGLRNPQGIAWHPQTGELWASNHGPSGRDSIVRIQRGGNYGWPQTCDERGDFIAAARCYSEFTLAPGGAAFHGDSLFVAGLRGEQVRRLAIRNGKVAQDEEWLSGMGRIREVVERDGWLYAATSNRDGRGRARQGDDRIVRIRPGPGAVSFRYGVLP